LLLPCQRGLWLGPSASAPAPDTAGLVFDELILVLALPSLVPDLPSPAPALKFLTLEL